MHIIHLYKNNSVPRNCMFLSSNERTWRHLLSRFWQNLLISISWQPLSATGCPVMWTVLSVAKNSADVSPPFHSFWSIVLSFADKTIDNFLKLSNPTCDILPSELYSSESEVFYIQSCPLFKPNFFQIWKNKTKCFIQLLLTGFLCSECQEQQCYHYHKSLLRHDAQQ